MHRGGGGEGPGGGPWPPKIFRLMVLAPPPPPRFHCRRQLYMTACAKFKLDGSTFPTYYDCIDTATLSS